MQKLTATKNNEINSLKVTITELRNELENAEFQKLEEIQKVESTFTAEILQLKESLASLRKKIENVEIKRDEVLQKMQQKVSAEKLWQDLVTNLRNELNRRV